MYVKAQKIFNDFLSDNLFRNSVYLMLTTGVMGLFGFCFWIICTKIFTPEEIGVGTTLISAMSLISLMSLLGFNSTFVRFLPTSQDRNAEINTGAILVMCAAAIIATGYTILIPYITPNLGVIDDSLWYSIGFIIMVTLASINSLTDSIFIAYRSAQYSLLTNGIIVSLTKLALPMLFTGIGAYGVFASSGLAASIGMIASIFFLMRQFGYKPELRINQAILKKVFHYSFTNYIANLLNIAPSLILPIIIINHLGASAAGYYYLAFMIINLLYTVSTSVSQSLFAEGSYGGNTLRHLVKKSVIFSGTIMLPGALLLAFFGPFVLEFFGKSYSAGGSEVIIILAITSPIVALYSMGSTLLRIRHQMYSLIVTNIIYALTISLLTLYWVDKGLVWVAIAWTVGNFIAALMAFIFIFIYRKSPTPLANS